jgi:hypothetical protein
MEMKLCWLDKTLVALSMDDKEDKMAESLDQINRLEAKFTVSCKVAFGISFKLTDWDPDNEEETMDGASTSSSQGTSTNVINIEDDDSKEKDKEHGIPSEAD